MEIRELEVGDWIRFQLDINLNLIARVKEWHGGVIYTDNGFFIPEKVIPVPITPEILEKNGWKYQEKLKFHLFKDDYILWLEWRESNKTLFIGDGLFPAPIEYVHQLQHILRLAGAKDIEI